MFLALMNLESYCVLLYKFYVSFEFDFVV